MTRHAIIVGAGVAGLGAAWWLARGGWTVTVVERSPNLRADGYMLGLSGPGYETAARMGLLPALKLATRDIDENVFLDHRGREVMRLRYRDFLTGLDWVTVLRPDLAEILHAACRDAACRDQVAIHFGVGCVEVLEQPDQVQVRLSDGRILAGDLLIGADGIRSTVRRQVFAEDDRALDFLGYRLAAFQMEDDIGLGRDFLSYVEPGRIAECYSLGDGRLATLFIWRCDDDAPIAADQRRPVLRAAFRDAHPQPCHWLDSLPAEAPLFFDSVTMVVLPHWSRRRCLLLGDAAHCLTLVSGQGAGMALYSASILAEELGPASGEAEITAALARHEARLRPAIRRLQKRSRQTASWFVPATRRGLALRNFLMRRLPRSLLAWHFRRGIRGEIQSSRTAASAPIPGPHPGPS